MRDHPNKRAIVIGASMGGMLAARVLADYCDEVTVCERYAHPTGMSRARALLRDGMRTACSPEDARCSIGKSWNVSVPKLGDLRSQALA